MRVQEPKQGGARVGKVQNAIERQRVNDKFIETCLENIALFIIFLTVLFVIPNQS